MSAVITLGFDDGNIEHFTVVKPMLERYGLQAVFFVVSGWVGKPGYMTEEQLLDLQASGHEIGGHTLTHPHLTGLTLKQQEREITTDKENLEQLGLSVTSFAYPYGEYSPETVALVKKAGYQQARAVDGISLESGDSLPRAEPLSLDGDRRFTLRTPGSVRRGTTLQQLQQFVLNAESVGGNLQLVFHHVCSEEPVYCTSPELLDDFLAWLAKRGVTQGILAG